MSIMFVCDRIYGDFEIDSPVLLELMDCKPMRRLKKIAQFGVPDEYYHLKNFSRFEHCLGVMLLLRRLGVSEEEQVAGLLHDVSHTAFCHVIDWVVEGFSLRENFQDTNHERFVMSTAIPEILSRHGFDPPRVIDCHRFGLLERDAPELCADRIDYSLREFPEPVGRELVQSLVVHDGKIVCSDHAAALSFARHYLRQNDVHWGGFEAVNRYVIFARALRRAMEIGVIAMDDIWTDDRAVLDKVEFADDHEINRLLAVLRQRSLRHLPLSGETRMKKFRYIDPEYLEDDRRLRLSETDSEFAAELTAAREVNSRGVPLVDV